MNIFQEVKERISMMEIVKGYGIDVNRSGFCLCPFHGEKTPSMKIYEKGYKCFGCGEGGDMFAFTQKFFNLSSIYEAAKKINQDFGLNIPIDKAKFTKKEFEATRNLTEERKLFEAKEKMAFEIISDYHKLLMEYSDEYRPQLGEVPDVRFIEFLTETERCEMIFDEMLEVSSKPLAEKQNYYSNEFEDYIEHIAKRLEQAKSAKQAEIDNAFSSGTIVSNIAANEAFSESSIIGTVLYKSIPEKSYLKYPNIIAPKIADKLESSGVKFSGRVYSKLTTFTVSKSDLNNVRKLARDITDKFMERNQPQIIPTEKQQQKQQKQMPTVKKPAMNMSI